MPQVEWWNLPLKKELRKRAIRKKHAQDSQKAPRRKAQQEWQLKREGVSESESQSLLTELERKRLWKNERKTLARIRSYRKR